MLAQQKRQLTAVFERALETMGASGTAVTLDRPKDAAHGDVASSVALQIAKRLARSPRDVATELAIALKRDSAAEGLIDTVEIAGPGFVNVRLSNAARQAVVSIALRDAERFGHCDTHAGEQVLIEFVSANPTGPLHLGHARQAALGDALAHLLATQGWTVSREFYYNDAGVQIRNLALSVQARAKELLGEPFEFPEAGYRGDYIIDIARDFLAKKTVSSRDRKEVAASGDANDLAAVERFAVAYLRNEQDADLAALGVSFDRYFLESSLYSDGKVEAAVKAMTDSGMTYEADGALWLRTTEFTDLGKGLTDDKDRVMRKSDGSYTYFVPDVAYHVTKIERGFVKAINVQGSDHHGTVARVRAGLQAASKSLGVPVPQGFPDYMLHKMLRVTRGGEEVKMSKRSGEYVTLRDLIDWVGRDAARYFLVARKADAEFVFDVDLARSQSEENPVYYLQYAHARISSVLQQARDKGFSVPDETTAVDIDLSPLVSAREQLLLNRMGEYPDVLQQAAEELAPHQLAFYLKDLAADFHGYYNAERVLVDEAGARNARLALLLATRQVLRNGLALLGLSAPERM